MACISARRVLARAALTALLVALPPLPSAIGGNNGKSGGLHGPLDGMSFVGTLGPEGEAGDRDDTIHFRDGQFWSEACVPCGFSPGPYWVRYAEDGIHFRGELKSPESGRFVYSGVVRDEHLTVTMKWHKDRWYWSIERNFWFEGDVVSTGPAARAQSATRVALAAASGPVLVCEP